MKSTAKFCPQCGSPAVNFSELANGEAKCRGCGWTGNGSELLLVPFSHDFMSDESVLINMVNDIRLLLSGELGVHYLRFLIKWGFIKANSSRLIETIDRKAFARYLAKIATAIAQAIIEERSRSAGAQVTTEESTNGG